jgi:hypothetical protein
MKALFPVSGLASRRELPDPSGHTTVYNTLRILTATCSLTQPRLAEHPFRQAASEEPTASRLCSAAPSGCRRDWDHARLSAS